MMSVCPYEMVKEFQELVPEYLIRKSVEKLKIDIIVSFMTGILLWTLEINYYKETKKINYFEFPGYFEYLRYIN